jgi:hypothetical protein
MNEVATTTGATVEGLGDDQRVFGAYGPGPARDVLSQLLHGTGYNVVMVGDQGQGTPREIVLSGRHSGTGTATSAPAAAADDDSDVEEQPAQPSRPAFGAGERSREDMQQRQQEMRQRMQDQQQQGQPPSNPPSGNPPGTPPS